MICRLSWLLAALWLGGCAGPLQLDRESEPSRTELQRLARSYFIKAKVFEQQNNYYGAIVALRSAADIDPTSATIFERLAWDYNRIDEYPMAIHFAQKALAIDPTRPELHYLVYQLLQIDGDQRGAIQALERMLEVSPDHWRLYFKLAQLYKSTGRTDRIEQLLNRALARPDAPVEVRVNIADIFAAAGRRQQAAEIYRQVLEEDLAAEDAWLGLGDLHKVERDTLAAVAIYRQAARILPQRPIIFREMARLIDDDADLMNILAEEDVEFLYELGSSLSDIEKFERATRVFEHIVAQSPSTAEEWLDLARFYLSRDDYAQVDQVLRRAAETMPDSSRVYLFWGLTKERQERFDEAAAIYRLGLETNPGDPGLWLYRGLLEEQWERWDDAISSYRRGLEHDPSDPDLHMRLGIVLGRQGRWLEATEHYRRSAALDLLSTRVLFHWGIALEKLGRWPEAIAKLNQAVQMDPADTHLLFYLGSCYEQASRQGNEQYFDDAIGTFERLLEIDPDDAYALNYLGYMLAEKGVRLEEALVLIGRAVELKPDNAAFFDSMGWVHFRLGDLQQAESYLDSALAVIATVGEEEGERYGEEERAIILDHAGDIAQALGKTATALEYWRQVLKLAPDDEAVRAKVQTGQAAP